MTRIDRVLPMLVVVMLAPSAHAESPWVLHSGIGLGVHRTTLDDFGMLHAVSSIGPGLRVDAGYRVHTSLAVGLHLGAQHIRALDQVSSDQFDEHSYVELEAGLSASVVVDRISVTPWFGLQGFHDQRQRAGGVTMGYDVRVVDRDRLGAFASLSYGSEFMRYYGLCLGVAYRYW